MIPSDEPIYPTHKQHMTLQICTIDTGPLHTYDKESMSWRSVGSIHDGSRCTQSAQ